MISMGTLSGVNKKYQLILGENRHLAIQIFNCLIVLSLPPILYPTFHIYRIQQHAQVPSRLSLQ